MVIRILLCITLSLALIKVPINYDSSFRDNLIEYLNTPESSSLKIMPFSDLENNRNVEYTARFSLGFPSQPVDLIIDTASLYIWVKSPGCFPCHRSDHSFDVGESATYKVTGGPINISDSSSILQGVLGSDALKVGNNEELSVSSQEFIVVNSEWGNENMSADGVVGFGNLGPNSGGNTLIDNLKANGQIANSVFSLYLNDNEYDNSNHPEPKSVLIFGGFDTSYALSHDSPLFTLNADLSTGYWQVPLTQVSIGAVNMSIVSNAAIFDSRKGYMTAPIADAMTLRKYFYQKYDECNFDNQGLIVCECKDLRKYPVFVLVLSGNQNIQLNPKDYFLKDGSKCLFLLAVDDSLPNTWRLGGPLLRKFYSIYDVDQGNVILYPAKVSKDHSHDSDETARWIIIFFVVLLIVICIVMSVFLYCFCCRHKVAFDENYKPLYTAKYNLPSHYHRTAVRTSSGEVVPDIAPTSRQNRVFPGISNKS